MKLNKILQVDFQTKKVTAVYTGEEGQTFTVLTPPVVSSTKRITDSIEKIDRLMREMKQLRGDMGDDE